MIRLRVVLVLFFGVFAVSLLPAALVDAGDTAQHSNSPTGTTRPYPGAAPCNTTLQACISGSAAGDSVQIAANTYVTDSLTITRAVSLIGGGANPSAVILRPTSGRMIRYSSVPITATFAISNLTVENGNSGGSSGGGIRVDSGAVPLFHSIVVSNNIGSGGGGIRIIPNTPATLINVTVFSNTSAADAGGISASGDLTLINSRIERNTADSNGGGIFVSGALWITNTIFDQNKALGGNGGSIYSTNNITLKGTSSVSKTAINNSTAITNGGGVFAEGNVLLVGNVSLNLNQATKGDGGGIYANNVSNASGGLFNTDNPSLSSNSANVNGGGIRALGNVTLTTFPAIVGNHTISTTGDVGAIYADGNVTVVSGLSQANRAHNGGIIYAGGNVSIKQHAASQSNAGQDGGCVYAVGNLEVLNDEFFRCSAGRNGGAFFAGQTVTITGAYNGSVLQFPDYQQNEAARGGLVYGSQVILRSITSFSNTAFIEGGAVYAASTADISASTFTTNTASYAGGAVVVSGTAFITDSIFTSNKVTGTIGIGGAVWVTGTLNISNSTFLSNTANGFSADGGGVGATERVTIIGGSFQGNTSSDGGGVRGLADVIVTNTIFTNNGGSNDGSGGGIAGITVTLNSVTMTKNTKCCSNSNGGALSATLALITGSTFIQNSSFISGGAVIANQVFITNGKFISNTGPNEGAGVWTKNGGTITNSIFNANNTGCCSSRKGGAVYSRGKILIYNSQFNLNQSDTGGAIYLQGSNSEIHDSTFVDNVVSGGGGAIDASSFGPFIFNSTFSGNSSGSGGGGAIRATSFLLVEASTFSNNSASGGDGGAIKRLVGSNNTTSITASTFISNYSATGGGAVFGKQADIENSTFISNHVASFAIGGAVDLFGSSFIGGDSFTDNRVDVPVGACSSGLGGAVYQDQSGSVIVQNSGFSRNSAPRGGALFAGSGGTIEQSNFNDNSAFCLDSVTLSNIGSGGAVDSRGFLSVKRSSFIHNSAGSVGGGAIAFLPFSASTLHVENSLFARNVATNTVFGAEGAAIVISQTATIGQLFFNTFTDQPRNPVSAIFVYSGTVSAVDNIISGHATGIKRVGGTAFENFNLFFNNTSNTGGGVSSGGNSFSGNPLFVSAATDNYHLTSSSPAIDAATDLGITEDYDGETRPNGSGFDIGFDESYAPQYKVYLPLVLKQS